MLSKKISNYNINVKAINTFKNSKKIVIKVGSSLLTNRKGNVNKYVLKNVVTIFLLY